MFVAYSKEVVSKKVFDINLTQDEVNTILGGDPYKAYPDLSVDKAKTIIVEIDNFYEYPTYDELEDTIREMTLIERHKNGLYELGTHEVVYNNDILRLEPGQFIDPEGTLQTVPKIEGTRVEWNWELNKWEDVATELEVAELQYAEYDALDKPSVIDEMNLVDPTLGEELKGMLIELRGIISTLKEQQPLSGVGYSSVHMPKPSSKLEEFKNKFNKFKK